MFGKRVEYEILKNTNGDKRYRYILKILLDALVYINIGVVIDPLNKIEVFVAFLVGSSIYIEIICG